MARYRAGQHAADNTVTGVISSGATWFETFQVKDQNGDNVTGLTADTFQFQFRCDEGDDSTKLVISTPTELSVSELNGATTVTINVPQSTISSMCGDYVADLVSKASDGKITHRAHGLVTFRNDPVSF